ncbi:MAG: VWA domain-containing protein [Myxococcales bacterium]|nr:VWA domain-containing protein [Myxococcales bacterium]
MTRQLFFCCLLAMYLAYPQHASALCESPNLLIILDKSGSMTNGNKWAAAKSGIQAMLQQYENKVRFGLISFSDKPTLEAPIDSAKSSILGALEKISPAGQTFMLPAIALAQQHLQDILSQDTIQSRPTSVLFLTDGSPSDRCPTAEVEALYNLSVKSKPSLVRTFVIGFGTLVNPSCLNQLSEKGKTAKNGPTKYFVASTQADLEQAMQAISQAATEIELCNGLDDDCDGEIDNMPGTKGMPLQEACLLGGCGGTRFCQAARWSACVPTVAPSQEICDGKDNDCNGLIDDAPDTQKAQSLQQPCKGACGDGMATCTAGRWQGCTADPKPETCDGQDNDCDGKIDEQLTRNCEPCGTQTCQAGAWGACTPRTPTAEVCNGQDDDCDGKIDNAPQSEQASSLTQACKTDCGEGVQYCVKGRLTACSAPAPQVETCNGKDDDCNGIIDDPWSEKTAQPVGGACQTSCYEGTYRCKADGSGVFCDGGKDYQEKCNGQDDDCDGKIDETWSALGQACQDGLGVCQKPGKMECSPDQTKAICVVKDPIQPQTERCNGQDDDCDGQTDEQLTRVCQHPCGLGHEVCLEGTWSGCLPPADAQGAACQETTPSRIDLPSPPPLVYAEGCSCSAASAPQAVFPWFGLFLLILFKRRR